MKKIKYTFIGLLLILPVFTGVIGASQIKGLEIDHSQELTLDFRGSRIKVLTWPRDYVKIEPTYMVEHEYEIKFEDNKISFNKEDHLRNFPGDLDSNFLRNILNEVFFVILIPEDLVVNIYAESVNVKNGCLIKSIRARNTWVRNSIFLNGFFGQGEKLVIRNTKFQGKRDLQYDKIIRESHFCIWGTH